MPWREAVRQQYQERLAGNPASFSAMQGHLEYLHDMVIDVRAQQVIELGVNTGQSTAAFLAGLIETGGQLWSCDEDGLHEPIKSLHGRVPIWEFVYGRDTDCLKIAPRPIDILLCDTTVDYDETLWQLRNYGALVRSGGKILVHDVTIESKREAVEAYLDTTAFTYSERDGSHGLGVIEVRR